MSRRDMPQLKTKSRCVCSENEPLVEALALWSDEEPSLTKKEVYSKILKSILGFPIPIRSQSLARQIEGVDFSLSFRLFEVIEQNSVRSTRSLDWHVYGEGDFNRIYELTKDDLLSRGLSQPQFEMPSPSNSDALDIPSNLGSCEEKLEICDDCEESVNVNAFPLKEGDFALENPSPNTLEDSTQNNLLLLNNGNINHFTNLDASTLQLLMDSPTHTLHKPITKPSRAGTDGSAESKKKVYDPQYRSGAWAILIAFVLSHESEPTLDPYELKIDKATITRLGGPYSKTSFESRASQYYSAWDGRKALINAGWLSQLGRKPILYSLNEEGWRTAVRCYMKEFGKFPNGNWSPVVIEMKDECVVDAGTPVQVVSPIAVLEKASIASTSRSPSPCSGSNSRGRILRKSNKDSRASSPTSALEASLRVFSTDFDANVNKFSDKYEVVILVDLRERELIFLLQAYADIVVIPVVLAVGDILWCARHRQTQQIFVLDTIIERKTVSDLIGSVRDNRYREQRTRLKKTKLPHIVYIIEGNLQREAGFEFSACNTVIAKLTSVFGMQVLNISTIDETALIIADTNKHLIEHYDTAPTSDLRIFEQTLAGEITKGLGEYYFDFDERLKKRAKMTRWKLFGMQLRQIRGCSPKIVLAIVKMYPTPTTLIRAIEEAEQHFETAKSEKMTRKDADRINPKYFLTRINCAPEEGEEQFIGKAVSEAVYDFFRGQSNDTNANIDSNSNTVHN